MQSMGLNLQAGQEAMRASMKEVKGKMADEIGTVRGGMTEPRGRAECVQPAMETGEFGTTSDATTIIGETCGVRHEGTTEKLKEVTETETEKLTETKGMTEKLVETREESGIKRETQEAKEGNELKKVKDEHTHT